ncbi:MAG: putative type II secretion system protein F [Verrucomicrobia subdivision 3 bacterium]|nr:putative type II secretion system protein F [Limisphaerales bacterium]MCS1417435.1 putative type II secretion system protein F [Limisphaerales bacterium]
MKSEELAFYNQQLAGMLRSGLPLEGALVELARDLQKGPLKEETQKLEKDLSQGMELGRAIQQRDFPPLYKRLLTIGAKSGKLAEVLILLADYYHSNSMIWNRFKGVAVYPLIILISAFFLSLFLTYSLTEVTSELTAGQSHADSAAKPPIFRSTVIILSPAVLGGLLLAATVVLCVPSARRKACWRLPGFHDANLAQTAAAFSMLLRSGMPLGDAIEMVRNLEPHSKVKSDLKQWRQRLTEGQSGFSAIASASASFPPLFIWLVASSGEAIAEGFEKASSLYQRRADYRAELLMTAAMPVSILFIGGVVILPMLSLMQLISHGFTTLSWL